MATTTNVTAGYTGEQAGEILIQAYKKSDTISKGCITVLPNVLGSGFLPKLSYSASQVAYTCGWSPAGTLTYLDKEVVVKKFKIDEEICKDNFANTFQAQQLNFLDADGAIPTTIQAAILEAMTSNLGAIIDDQIWNGDNTANEYNGLLTQFLADAAVVDVDFAAATDKSNVVGQLEQMVSGLLPAIDGDEDVVIAVSKDFAKAYKSAQASMGNNTTVGDKELNYLGYRIESIGGLPSSTAVMYRVKNVAFLTGMESNINEVRISDDETRLDGNLRTKIAYTGNVGYSFGEEIVWGRVIA